MHDECTPLSPVGDEAQELSLSLAFLVQRAQRLPRGSDARRAVVDAVFTVRGALDDLTVSRRVSLERAKGIAEAATRVGLATWPEGQGFEPGEALRARLASIGVSSLAHLHGDEADDVEAWVALAA